MLLVAASSLQPPAVTGALSALVLLMVLALWLALALDWRFGEPSASWHPVVWMGQYLGYLGNKITGLSPLPAFCTGALAWTAGVLAVGVMTWGLQTLVLMQLAHTAAQPGLKSAVAAIVSVAVLAWLLKCMFSWRMLHDEVGAVEAALAQSLSAGRQRLSLLVSRDTGNLSESEVRESAIESLAENLNDSVVAPIFWFVLFGLPGAAIYRFANTADAMWGYRGRWEWAGKWAAHADDVLSCLPARLTALLIWAVARNFRLGKLRPEALRTPSPNSGWPMSAMALALGVGLRKPGVYTLNAAGRPAEAADTASAQRYASKAVFALVLLAKFAIFTIAVSLFVVLSP